MPISTTRKARRRRAARLSLAGAGMDSGALPGRSSTEYKVYGSTQARVRLAWRLLAAAGALAPLALVHRPHASHRDGVAFLDELVGDALRFRHLRSPRVSVAEELERVVHGEVGRGDGVEIVPAHREGDRRARSHPWAVGGDDGGAAH